MSHIELFTLQAISATAALMLCLIVAGCSPPSSPVVAMPPSASAPTTNALPVSEQSLAPDVLQDNIGTLAQSGSINCAQTLPCSWRSSDQAINVSLVTLDTWADGRTGITLLLSATRDTSIKLEQPRLEYPSMIDTIAPIRLEIADSPDSQASANIPLTEFETDTPDSVPPLLSTTEGAGMFRVVLQAGRTTTIKLVSKAESNEMVNASLSFATFLIEAQQRSNIQFKSLPARPMPTEPVDCFSQLPCTWRDAEQGYDITLVLLERLIDEEKLVAVYYLGTVGRASFITGTDTLVTAGADTSIVSGLHTLGDDYNGTITLEAGETALGIIDLLGADAALSELSTIAIDVAPLQAFEAVRPVFKRVPIR